MAAQCFQIGEVAVTMSIKECERFLNEFVSPRLDQIAAGFLDPNVKVTLIVRSEARRGR